MQCYFTPSALRDYQYWRSMNMAIHTRTDQLIQDMLETPFTGLGKPCRLFDNFWSRRLDTCHRLVYSVREQALEVVSVRYHFD